MSELEEWEKAVEVMDYLLKQTYYRVLSFVSFHFPIEDAYKAAQQLKTKRGGDVYWIVEGKVARWDELEVFPEVYMTIWFFGGQKNTVMARRGWWAMYVLETSLAILETAIKSLSIGQDMG